jgi:hypothetical protein
MTDLDKRLTEARELARLKRELDSCLFLQPDAMRAANVCSFSDPEPLRGRQWCSVHSQSKAFCDAQFRPLPEVDECPNCAWSPSDKADETPKKAQPLEVIAREAEIARLEAAEKDGEIARIRTALEYKNTTIERMQAEHDDALEAKDAEISRLKDELSRWKHVC